MPGLHSKFLSWFYKMRRGVTARSQGRRLTKLGGWNEMNIPTILPLRNFYCFMLFWTFISNYFYFKSFLDETLLHFIVVTILSLLVSREWNNSAEEKTLLEIGISDFCPISGNIRTLTISISQQSPDLSAPQIDQNS